MNVEELLREKAAIIDEAMEKYLPRAFSKDSLLFKINQPSYAHNLKTLDKAVAEPIWEFLDRGGKRWRGVLFLLICEALTNASRDFVDYALIPEVIHNGTLIVDDIEDSSEYRRGKLCTHRVYGSDIAINVGNAMYYLALLPLIENRARIPTTKIKEVYEIYVREMINLSLGQAMDIAWHRGLLTGEEIDEKAYLQMCAFKTGTLARMTAKIAAVLSDASDELVEQLGHFSENMGIAFQMIDDVLDLTSGAFTKRKGGLGRDITEGKRSMPVIHTLEFASTRERKRLCEILGMHTSDRKIIEEAIKMMKKYGSIEYTQQLARRLIRESWSMLEKSLPASKATERLKVFTEFLVERKI